MSGKSPRPLRERARREDWRGRPPAPYVQVTWRIHLLLKQGLSRNEARWRVGQDRELFPNITPDWTRRQVTEHVGRYDRRGRDAFKRARAQSREPWTEEDDLAFAYRQWCRDRGRAKVREFEKALDAEGKPYRRERY